MSQTVQACAVVLDSNLVSTIVGAGAALLGGWLTVRWSHHQSRRSVAASLLAEIESQRFLDPDGKVDEFTLSLLDHLARDGHVPHGDFLAHRMREDLEFSGLVYQSSLGSLGFLPNGVARDLIAYWTKRRALISAGVALMSSDHPLMPEEKRAPAMSLQMGYAKLKELRENVSRQLREIAD
jgi:hypothetical protein